MTVNAHALLRHSIIDNCLRDPSRRYTLDDLREACTRIMRPLGGSRTAPDGKISVRTLQLDLQFMRDPEKGYGAPIVVFNRKYYKYRDPAYSIRKAPLREAALEDVGEIIDTLRRYAAFDGLHALKNAADILAEELEAKVRVRDRIVAYEGKRNSVGLEYFNVIHDAILHRKALCIGYHSSRSNNIMSIIFYPLYLKEYRGRWFAMGYKDGLRGVYKLPLDRIRDYSYSILPFPQGLQFDPGEYFRDIIGVTRLSGEVREIRLLVKNKLAPFIRINPLHASQQVTQVLENGDVELSIRIIPNQEFYNAVLEYLPLVQVISPRDVGMQLHSQLREIAGQLPDYDRPDPDGENAAGPEDLSGDGWSLFPNL